MLSAGADTVVAPMMSQHRSYLHMTCIRLNSIVERGGSQEAPQFLEYLGKKGNCKTERNKRLIGL